MDQLSSKRRESRGVVLGARAVPDDGDSTRPCGDEVCVTQEIQSDDLDLDIPWTKQASVQAHQELERRKGLRVQGAGPLSSIKPGAMAPPTLLRARSTPENTPHTRRTASFFPGPPKLQRQRQIGVRDGDHGENEGGSPRSGRQGSDQESATTTTCVDADAGAGIRPIGRMVLWPNWNGQESAGAMDPEEQEHDGAVPSRQRGKRQILEWFHGPGTPGIRRGETGGTSVPQLSAASRWFASQSGGQGEPCKHELDSSDSDESDSSMGVLVEHDGHKGGSDGCDAADEEDRTRDSDSLGGGDERYPDPSGAAMEEIWDERCVSGWSPKYADIAARGFDPCMCDGCQRRRIRRVRESAPTPRVQPRKRGFQYFMDEADCSGPDSGGEEDGSSASDDTDLSGFIAGEGDSSLELDAKTTRGRKSRIVESDEEELTL